MLPELQLRIRVTGRHPWFFRKMIRKPEQRIPAGSAVFVRDRDRKPVGTGFYNPRTDLALRLFAYHPLADEDAVRSHLVEMLQRAWHRREKLLSLPDVTNAYRLVHSEGDGFPGLVLDRLGDTVVAQLFSLGMQKYIEPIGEWLLTRKPRPHLVLTADSDARKREGMDPIPPSKPRAVDLNEHGLRYRATPGHGHKTGFFADQRDHRLRLRQLARGRKVLDLCCHAGGFALNAAAGEARSVRAVDLDEAAVALARDNAKHNQLKIDCQHGDAFDVLRELPEGRSDLIILDPPKWAKGAGEVDDALRRYRDLNQLAFEKLPVDGMLVTCSCSGAVREHRFLEMLDQAAARAGRSATLLHVGGAGADHPVALDCPETRYLKVAFVAVR